MPILAMFLRLVTISLSLQRFVSCSMMHFKSYSHISVSFYRSKIDIKLKLSIMAVMESLQVPSASSRLGLWLQLRHGTTLF